MRVTFKFDSASTADVRVFARALNAVGRTAELTVGLNGPEAWCGATPALDELDTFHVATVLTELVRVRADQPAPLPPASDASIDAVVLLMNMGYQWADELDPPRWVAPVRDCDPELEALLDEEDRSGR